MSQEQEALKCNPLFKDFSEEVLERFVSTAEKRSYTAGDLIFAETTTSDEIFVVLDGEVDVEVALANADRNFEIVTLGVGEILGEVSFIEEGERSATATAKTDVKLLVWRFTSWRTICEEDYEVGYKLVLGISRVLCRRLRRWSEQILNDVSWGLE